jgi:signal transduction histidine kinase
MASLVNDLLNVARIESGRIQVAPTPTDPVLLAEKALENFQPIINEKKLKVKTVFENIGTVNLDPELVGEVLFNLISNAIKYSPTGGEVELSIKNTGKNFTVEIKDRGLGIPKSQQDKIFSKFFRGGNAVLVDTDGNGLGLYICKAIVESSKGKIWFESKEGRGTTFWFSMPKSGMIKKVGERKLITTNLNAKK